MQHFEVLGFASWASALFNGDFSGLTEEDIIDLEQWLIDLPKEAGPLLDYRLEGFRHNVYNGIGGEAATYIWGEEI